MDWNYEVEILLQHPVSVTVNLLGQQVQLRFTLKAAATSPGKIEGGVSFDCRTPVFVDGCHCLMHDLRRRNPVVTTQFATDIYATVSAVGGTAGTTL